MKSCLFCEIERSKEIASNNHALAIYDRYPISVGHTLIIPKRHIASIFDLTSEEQSAMLELLAEMRRVLLGERSPDGFNIGINDGTSAGQTIMHLHVHLIPRYFGDQPDPRGGVRWIFPDKAEYWNNQ